MTTRTRQLTRELANQRVTVSLKNKKAKSTKKLLLLFALFVLAIGVSSYFSDDGRIFSAWLPLDFSNVAPPPVSAEDRWRAEFESLEVKYQVEVASRKALEQQILTLDSQIKEMQAELDFFRKNSGQTRR